MEVEEIEEADIPLVWKRKRLMSVEYVEGAVEVSNAAFAEMQKGPHECHILDELAARPDMSVEEIRALEMPRR